MGCGAFDTKRSCRASRTSLLAGSLKASIRNPCLRRYVLASAPPLKDVVGSPVAKVMISLGGYWRPFLSIAYICTVLEFPSPANWPSRALLDRIWQEPHRFERGLQAAAALFLWA